MFGIVKLYWAQRTFPLLDTSTQLDIIVDLECIPHVFVMNEVLQPAFVTFISDLMSVTESLLTSPTDLTWTFLSQRCE